MKQHFSKQPLPTPPAPFSEAQDPTLTSGLFWARLLTYRPLFLLGGLWLTLVCVSAIAYHGLMFNEPVEEADYSEAPLTVVETLPESQSASAADALPAADAAPADVTAARSGPVASSSIALWALLSLVGLCGFGCFALTQQIKSCARPTKRKKPRPRPVMKASAPPPQPQRLAPYSPQRDGVVVPGHRIVEAPAPTLSASVALPNSKVRLQPQGTPWSQPVPKLAANRLQSDPRPMPRPNPLPQPGPQAAALPSRNPAVVPDEADLVLDWPEGSVAHALDVRQRRSLSSFM
ncbi:hypothetical protein C8255_15795 [filamentous cyanobacterium CCP3]|nr:hypothetical protein C8255_15795 [filamentous cyanobacterium CCP3]